MYERVPISHSNADRRYPPNKQRLQSVAKPLHQPLRPHDFSDDSSDESYSISSTSSILETRNMRSQPPHTSNPNILQHSKSNPPTHASSKLVISRRSGNHRKHKPTKPSLPLNLNLRTQSESGLHSLSSSTQKYKVTILVCPVYFSINISIFNKSTNIAKHKSEFTNKYYINYTRQCI